MLYTCYYSLHRDAKISENYFYGEIIFNVSIWTHLPACGIYANWTSIGTRYHHYHEAHLRTFQLLKSSILERIELRQYTEIRSFWHAASRYSIIYRFSLDQKRFGEEHGLKNPFLPRCMECGGILSVCPSSVCQTRAL